jgi:hypothetical protein
MIELVLLVWLLGWLCVCVGVVLLVCTHGGQREILTSVFVCSLVLLLNMCSTTWYSLYQPGTWYHWYSCILNSSTPSI